jgi:hypothetical protein
MRTFIGGMLARSVAETGSDDAGFDLLAKIHRNVNHYEGSPEILFESLEHGPAAVTVWLLTDLVFQRRAFGYHFLPAGLDEPVPVTLDCIALVRGAPGATPEARAFYGSSSTQLDAMEIFARTHARIPVRRRLRPAKLIEGDSRGAGDAAAGRPSPGHREMPVGCAASRSR